jgi:hypothetical protein
MVAIPKVKVQKPVTDMPSAVKSYSKYAIPNAHSFGDGWRVTLALWMLVSLATGASNLLFTAIALLAVSKAWGLEQERKYINNEIVPSIEAADLKEVRQRMEERFVTKSDFKFLQYRYPEEKQEEVWEALITAGYIDERGVIQDKFNGGFKSFSLPVELPRRERKWIFQTLRDTGVMPPAVRERLINKLEKKGFSLLDIPAAAARFARNSLRHFWSLGAGLKFFATSTIVLWAATMHTHIAGALGLDEGTDWPLYRAVRASIALTIVVLLPISKLVGIVKQRLSLNALLAKVKTDEDKPALRQAIKEQDLAPRAMNRAIKRYERTFNERWS